MTRCLRLRQPKTSPLQIPWPVGDTMLDGRFFRKAVYRTKNGGIFEGKAEEVLSQKLERLRGKINLIFTSPPFPLNRKKRYGNLLGQEYTTWLSSFGSLFKQLLTSDGSLVIELGNAWEPGSPVMSTLAIKSLIALQEAAEFFLCQEFVCYNPARLPTPAQWVNVERIRVKDSYTRLWWLSAVERPKADNRRVLQPYSQAMKRLLETGKYNAGARPSEHHIGATSFLKDNQGAIPPNVLEIANTRSQDEYIRYCKTHKSLIPRQSRGFENM